MRAACLSGAVAALVSLTSTVIAEETTDEAAVMEKIKQLGGTFHNAVPMGLSVSLEPIPTLAVPYWAITIPLVLLSAYLLLSKSRSATSKAEPAR
jgi:hypothetical protein